MIFHVYLHNLSVLPISPGAPEGQRSSFLGLSPRNSPWASVSPRARGAVYR